MRPSIEGFNRSSRIAALALVGFVMGNASCGLVSDDDAGDMHLQVSNLGESTGGGLHANIHFADGAGRSLEVDRADMEVTIEERVGEGP